MSILMRHALLFNRLGSNAKRRFEMLYGAITSDPMGLAVDTVNGAYESVVTCVTTSTCIAPAQTQRYSA